MSTFDKTPDERIRDQTVAMILSVNDTCPDELFRKALRSVVMSEVDRMHRRLKELTYDEWRRDNSHSNGNRRNDSQPREPQ